MNLESLKLLADIERKNKVKGIDPSFHYALEAILKNTIRFLEIGILELLSEVNDENTKKEIVLAVRKKIKTKYNIDKNVSANFLRNLKTKNEEELKTIKFLLNAT
jgi:hypothetical protein